MELGPSQTYRGGTELRSGAPLMESVLEKKKDKRGINDYLIELKPRECVINLESSLADLTIRFLHSYTILHVLMLLYDVSSRSQWLQITNASPRVNLTFLTLLLLLISISEHPP